MTPVTFTMSKARYEKAIFKSLGQAVTRRRTQLKQTLEELAEKARLDAAYIKDIEMGVRNLNLSTLWKVSRSLDCSLSELLADAECLMNSEKEQKDGLP